MGTSVINSPRSPFLISSLQKKIMVPVFSWFVETLLNLFSRVSYINLIGKLFKETGHLVFISGQISSLFSSEAISQQDVRQTRKHSNIVYNKLMNKCANKIQELKNSFIKVKRCLSFLKEGSCCEASYRSSNGF